MNILSSFKGDYIGEGISRIVYTHKNNPNWVIKELKKSHKSKNFSIDNNYLEYQNFKLFQKYQKDFWLAPCYYQNGYLIMKKVNPCIPEEKMIPSMFPDNIKNWGILNDRLVCSDYEVLKYSEIENDTRNYFRWTTKNAGYFIPKDVEEYFINFKKNYNLTEENFSYKTIDSKECLELALSTQTKMRI